MFILNTKIDQAYFDNFTDSLPSLNKKASDAIKSFAELVDELNKIGKLADGTPVKAQIKDLTANMNNTQVFFTRMLTEQLGVMHNIVNGDNPEQEAVKETV